MASTVDDEFSQTRHGDMMSGFGWGWSRRGQIRARTVVPFTNLKNTGASAYFVLPFDKNDVLLRSILRTR